MKAERMVCYPVLEIHSSLFFSLSSLFFIISMMIGHIPMIVEHISMIEVPFSVKMFLIRIASPAEMSV